MIEVWEQVLVGQYLVFVQKSLRSHNNGKGSLFDMKNTEHFFFCNDIYHLRHISVNLLCVKTIFKLS